MSHQPERKEKDCLNCGAEVYGRYCHACGQENIVTHQSFWSLARHFVYDIFHFDGKFFDTLKYLLFRPGFVPEEYLKGKRASYLDPIRMYLFTSAVFFLIFFSIKSVEDGVKPSTDDGEFAHVMSIQERFNYAGKISESLRKGEADSNYRKQLHVLLDTNYRIRIKPDTGQPKSDTTFRVLHNNHPYLATPEKIKTFDSLSKNEGWLGRMLKKSWRNAQKKYGDDNTAVLIAIGDSFMHKFPYLLFISLPFFALILKGLYARQKNFYYNDHAVFTLYHYIFMFILLLIYFLLDYLSDLTGAGIFGTAGRWLLLLSLLYLYVSMKRFYGQGWGKTFAKFILLNFQAMILIFILVLIFLLFSFIQM